jgi:hypothetical protein
MGVGPASTVDSGDSDRYASRPATIKPTATTRYAGVFHRRRRAVMDWEPGEDAELDSLGRNISERLRFWPFGWCAGARIR